MARVVVVVLSYFTERH